jgi:membrane fusion protein (multidrug efflux system)
MFRNPVARIPLLLPLIALVAGLAGCAGGPAETENDEVARNVRVMPLETSAVTEFFEIAGPVVPVRGTDISAEEGGTVEAIVNDKGARVAAGAPLVTLDRRLLGAELEAADAGLALQRYNRDKTLQLFEAGKISRLEMLQAESAFAEAQSRRDMAHTRHDRARVKAPFAGIVADRFVEAGQLVAPGMPVARVIDPYVLKLEGALTEAEVAWVREGMTSSVRLEGTEEAVPGRVAWVGFEASPRNGKFPVEIHVANPDLAYRSGVIGRARVAKRTTGTLVVIPRDAILPGERIDHVFVVENDRAVKRRVELGPSQGLMVAVRRGLDPDELLVVRGQRELQDGSLVEITERVAYGDGTGGADPDAIRSSSAATRVSGEVAR